MSSVVIAIAHVPENRAVFERLASSAEGGEEWSVGDRHTVESRLTYAPAVVAGVMLPGGFTCDIGCRDDTSKAAWGERSYDLFFATGDWDEATGLRVIDGMTDWIREQVGEPERFQAGIDTAGVSLVLIPEGDTWRETERFE